MAVVEFLLAHPYQAVEQLQAALEVADMVLVTIVKLLNLELQTQAAVVVVIDHQAEFVVHLVEAVQVLLS